MSYLTLIVAITVQTNEAKKRKEKGYIILKSMLLAKDLTQLEWIYICIWMVNLFDIRMHVAVAAKLQQQQSERIKVNEWNLKKNLM